MLGFGGLWTRLTGQKDSNANHSVSTMDTESDQLMIEYANRSDMIKLLNLKTPTELDKKVKARLEGIKELKLTNKKLYITLLKSLMNETEENVVALEAIKKTSNDCLKKLVISDENFSPVGRIVVDTNCYLNHLKCSKQGRLLMFCEYGQIGKSYMKALENWISVQKKGRKRYDYKQLALDTEINKRKVGIRAIKVRIDELQKVITNLSIGRKKKTIVKTQKSKYFAQKLAKVTQISNTIKRRSKTKELKPRLRALKSHRGGAKQLQSIKRMSRRNASRAQRNRTLEKLGLNGQQGKGIMERVKDRISAFSPIPARKSQNSQKIKNPAPRIKKPGAKSSRDSDSNNQAFNYLQFSNWIPSAKKPNPPKLPVELKKPKPKPKRQCESLPKKKSKNAEQGIIGSFLGYFSTKQKRAPKKLTKISKRKMD